MTTHLLKSKKRRPSAKRGANGRLGASRISAIVINGSVHIPLWVTDHESFRLWACSEDFPQRGQFFYLRGQFWVDLNMEKMIHNKIKGAISAAMFAIVSEESLGHFLVDRMLLTHLAAGLSCEPDGMFVSNDSLERETVTINEGDEALEIIGSPNMTLEVISKSSVEKDTVILPQLYAKAGIAEYWLVDSTVEMPELVVMRLSGGKYVPTRKNDGWIKSSVFGRSFRLTCKKDAKDLSHFNLETK